MGLIFCIVVESSCLLTHNIVPHISWHDLPCPGTTKRYSDFPSMVIFPLLQRKFWIQTWFCNCPQYRCLFHIVFEVRPRYTWSRNDVGSPKSTSLFSTFHIGSFFCFFPPDLVSSTCTDKNSPFSRKTKNNPRILRFFPNSRSGIQISGHSEFLRIFFTNSRNIFHFDLSFIRYCISCLFCAPR